MQQVNIPIRKEYSSLMKVNTHKYMLKSLWKNQKLRKTCTISAQMNKHLPPKRIQAT
jgi:hypothetical protein